MLRKFYIFQPKEEKLPMVTALGYFNTKAFEEACRNNRIRCAVISEASARTVLQRSNGIGVGVYTRDSAIEAPEGLKREIAARNRTVLAGILQSMEVEPVIDISCNGEIIHA